MPHIDLTDPTERRRLRALPDLDPGLAERLLAYEDDYRQARRDRTLDAPVRVAPHSAVVRHATALASGAAAPALWTRLRDQLTMLADLASGLASGQDLRAAETTLYLLVLDPLNPYRLSEDAAVGISISALRSPHASVRGLAAEYLARQVPHALLSEVDRLVADTEERTRAIAWDAAFQLASDDARERAAGMLVDESLPVPVRRSALVALGTHLPTNEVIEALSYALLQPDTALASDAANLLHERHRHPAIAETALRSPHAAPREVAAVLMDPYRGSPAAGGSRPGDPTRGGDIFEELVRRLERAQEEQAVAARERIDHTSAPQECESEGYRVE